MVLIAEIKSNPNNILKHKNTDNNYMASILSQRGIFVHVSYKIIDTFRLHVGIDAVT